MGASEVWGASSISTVAPVAKIGPDAFTPSSPVLSRLVVTTRAKPPRLSARSPLAAGVETMLTWLSAKSPPKPVVLVSIETEWIFSESLRTPTKIAELSALLLLCR